MRIWFLSLMFKTKPVLHKLAKLPKTAQTAEIKAFTTEVIMLVWREKANVSTSRAKKQTTVVLGAHSESPFTTQTVPNFILK